MSTSDRLELDDIIEIAPGRRVRLRLGSSTSAIKTDWRGRIAVRNVVTNRLSYIPAARLLSAKQRGGTRVPPEAAPTPTPTPEGRETIAYRVRDAITEPPR